MARTSNYLDPNQLAQKWYESWALAFLSHKGFAPNQLGRYGSVFEQRDELREGTIERWLKLISENRRTIFNLVREAFAA